MYEMKNSSRLAMPNQMFALTKTLSNTGSRAAGEKFAISPTCFIPLPKRILPNELKRTMQANRTYVRLCHLGWELMHCSASFERTSSVPNGHADIQRLRCTDACARSNPTM